MIRILSFSSILASMANVGLVRGMREYSCSLLVIDRMIFVGESVGAPTIQFEDEDLVNGQFKNAHDHCWLITASPSAVGFCS